MTHASILPSPRPRKQLLLPFSLYGGAAGGFQNRSLIAMLAVGSACLVAYPIYEWKFAKFPSMPKRILLNRTFCTAVVRPSSPCLSCLVAAVLMLRLGLQLINVRYLTLFLS